MRLNARVLAAFLLAIQGWLAVSGGSGGLGCVRLWACLAEQSVQEDECACCRERRSQDAPSPSAPDHSDHDSGCCVTLPDMATSTQRHDVASDLSDVLGMALVMYAVADISWMPIGDRCGHPTWSPPPDPGTLRTAAGLRTTRLLI